MREAIAGRWGTLAAMIRAHAFRDGIPLEDDLLLGDAERLLEDEHVFVWIDVEEPSDEEIDALGAVFGLHPVTIETRITCINARRSSSSRGTPSSSCTRWSWAQGRTTRG